MKRPWKSPWLLAVVVIVSGALSAPALLGLGDGSPFDVNAWQRMASPGPLARAHATLENDCSACHSPVTGTPDDKCVQCHASSETLLLLQPTAFHADIGSCRVCHREHVGRRASISEMDHVALADLIGVRLRQNVAAGDQEADARRRQVAAWSGQSVAGQLGRGLQIHELALNCNECHSKEDPHAGYFGTACAACHATAHWKITSYRHPSDLSTDCEQCHRAPLSHSSPMFESMCTAKLGKAGTPVADCNACHRITSWFEIRGAPWHQKTMGHGFGR